MYGLISPVTWTFRF